MLSLAHEQLTAFALEAFVTQADALNQHHRETFTARFPKVPSRWLSHEAFTPRPLELTREGALDGGLSGLVGAPVTSASPARSVRRTLASEAAPATIRPA